MAELRFQLSGERVLQVEPRHLNLLFGTVAWHVCLVPHLRAICLVDHAQFTPDDLALGVDKALPPHLCMRHVLLRRVAMLAREIRRLG